MQIAIFHCEICKQRLVQIPSDVWIQRILQKWAEIHSLDKAIAERYRNAVRLNEACRSNIDYSVFCQNYRIRRDIRWLLMDLCSTK